jgi:uncharacterized membrane protein YhhN
MQKIIIQIGLLVFFLAVLFFTRLGLPLQDILIRSTVMFFALTIILSVIAIIFLKSAKKVSSGLNDEYSDNPPNAQGQTGRK